MKSLNSWYIVQVGAAQPRQVEVAAIVQTADRAIVERVERRGDDFAVE